MNYISQYSKAFLTKTTPTCVTGALFMCIHLYFYTDQHSANFGVLRPYWGLYLMICRGFKDAHVHINVLQRMNIPWSLENHTEPVRVESRCRNCRHFFIESQCCPGLHPGPRELLLQMANSSGNSSSASVLTTIQGNFSFPFRLWFKTGE